MADPSGISQEQAAWAAADSLAFYASHRQTPDDLYPSERFFLPEAVRAATTCLDIGCAAGGFSRIMKSFNPAIAYTGVDITPEFIRHARGAFPDSAFEVGDGVTFPTPPDSYDLVYSSGILHVNSHYREIVRAAYTQARNVLLCDFRLTWGPDVVGTFRVNFDESGPPSTQPELPYVVLNVDRLVTELRELQPAPRSVTIRGYYHAPSPTAELPLSKILMAFARIEKGRGGESTTVTLELPREDDVRA